MVERFEDDGSIFKLLPANPTKTVIPSGVSGTLEAIQIVLQDTDPDNWLNPLLDLKDRAPTQELTFGGIFATSFLVIFGPVLGTALSEFAAGVFLGEGNEQSAFLFDEVIPRLQERLDEASINPLLTRKISLFKKEVGVLVKLVSLCE
jgi:hypothetical protein